MRISYRLENKQDIQLKISNFNKKIAKRAREGVIEAGKAYKKYVVDDLLTGEVLEERTGNLRRDIKVRTVDIGEGHYSVEVRVDARSAKVAEWMIEGRGPNSGWGKKWEIPGNPWLLFYWEGIGKNVRFRSVMHPGYESRDFISIGAEDMKETIKDIIKGRIIHGK